MSSYVSVSSVLSTYTNNFYTYTFMLRQSIMQFSAKMSFGDDDEVDSDMTVTTDSVTLRWREGKPINDTRAAPYIGYNILIRKEHATFTSVRNVAFYVTPDQWQEVTVEGLEPDTQYWFDIAVYRIYSDGRIFQNDDYTAKDQFGLITGSTMNSTIILYLRK